MKSDKEKLISIYETTIKDRWFPIYDEIDGRVAGDGYKGELFESLLGKKIDNVSRPDFGTIEVKTKSRRSSSLVTLATKAPTNTLSLRDLYGREVSHDDSAKFKRLSMTFGATGWTNTKVYSYNFRVVVDRISKKIFIQIRDLDNNTISTDEYYWDFEVVQKIIEAKLSHIAFVQHESKIEDNIQFIKYSNVSFITSLTWESFLNALEAGKIRVDIRMGAYKTGKNIGKLHDHGTGFRISQSNLFSL